jgi:hypothetical protein
MTCLTAFVIVFALTGAPIANAVCVVSCHGQHSTAACEESMAQPAISSGNDVCPTLIADTPFAREDGRIVWESSAALAAQPLATALTRDRLSRIHDCCVPIGGRRVQSVVLRL